jgi:hypothetical protein
MGICGPTIEHKAERPVLLCNGKDPNETGSPPSEHKEVSVVELLHEAKHFASIVKYRVGVRKLEVVGVRVIELIVCLENVAVW